MWGEKDKQEYEEEKKKAVFLVSTYCWLGIVLDALHILVHFIFTTILMEIRFFLL